MKVVNIVGYSGSGKTTLTEKLVSIFCEAGLNVAAIKSAHHHLDIDKPGKDSYRYRAAGARQVILRNEEQYAVMVSTPMHPASLEDLIKKLDPCDLVLVEGFKAEHYATLKMEVWRPGVKNEAPLYTKDERIDALITNVDAVAGFEGTVLNIDDERAVARYIADKLDLNARN